MAPIKFEEHIKEKLENRRVKPSEQAWDKLSERLDAQEKNNNHTPYWWLGIAASIVGVLFVVSQLINKPKDLQPVIVDSPVDMESKQIEPSKPTKDKKIQEETFIENTLEKSEYKTILKEKTAIINNTNQNQFETLVAKNETERQENDIINNKSVEVIKEKLSFEEQQIKDVVAKVEALKNNNESVSEDDIDALLMQAQKEIRLNNLINETTGVVDANALLQDVEADLDQSFRTKVFEALKSSYNSVKTAVAQRNN